MGQTRDLFKKLRATKGTFHAKMGSIRDNYPESYVVLLRIFSIVFKQLSF